jgi:hypothetical protein
MAKLWAGDSSDYASPSEADLALVGFIAPLLGRNRELIEDLWRQSGLNREKLDREDYRRRTIAKVLGTTTSNGMSAASLESIIDPDEFVYGLSEFLELDLPPPEWLVEGLLEKGSLNMVFGPGGVVSRTFSCRSCWQSLRPFR